MSDVPDGGDRDGRRRIAFGFGSVFVLRGVCDSFSEQRSVHERLPVGRDDARGAGGERVGGGRDLEVRPHGGAQGGKTAFRSVTAAARGFGRGDNSCEMELGAAGNVNFDMGRYGIGFTASPRHADGVVVTGPVTANMARELEATWQAVPEPKVLIAVGTDAISGGLFAESPAVNRSFFEVHRPDLYVPGNPTHPMTFITGVRALVERVAEEKETEAVAEEPTDVEVTEEAATTTVEEMPEPEQTKTKRKR